MKNLLTDIDGLKVGAAEDQALASGVSVVLFEQPAIASIAILGGAPGTRDTALLEPEMTVERVDALVLSGGSAFGLDAAGGVMAGLAAKGRGFAVKDVRVPIVPQAIVFDLLNGGDKSRLHDPEARSYYRLGLQALDHAQEDFKLGSHGAGYGATIADLKGGLGSASARLPDGTRVGALVVVNAVGQATIGEGPHFWAAPYELNEEFGGLGLPDSIKADALKPKFKGAAAENTTIAVIATDAPLTKAQCKRLALAAHDGLARAIRPIHTPMDGDVIFAASTAASGQPPIDSGALALLCNSASDVLARAVARGIYEATALPFAGALPDYRTRFQKRSIR
jgi:L-aminopeptidase/D-esterase-like protein